ncbi:MAG: ribose-phosphate diphosphokinase [Candidatus Nanohaloarchaea archaeon]|nr:ribose-phosphate diphosphokinase [Candidatus Nanohaloarchaea archaeon]
MRTVLTPTAEHLDLDAETLDRHPNDDSLEFPDGEVYVQLEGVEDVEDALVVHSGAPGPNTGLMHLFGTLELLRENDVDVEVMFTYFPYGMQDEEFFPGTLNYASSILRKLEEYYRVEEIHAVDAHFAHRDWTSDYGFHNLNSFPWIRDERGIEDRVVMGPDLGAVERFGIPGFEKERKGSRQVEMKGEMDVEGEDVVVFDDIIETGTTMLEAHDALKEEGAETVEAAAVHGVMEEGVDRVAERFDRLHLTNTVESEHADVDIEPFLREELNL